METLSVILLALALTAFALLAAIGYLYNQRTIERGHLEELLQPDKGESLEKATRRLVQQAAVCDEVPRLKSRYDQMMLQSPMCVLLLDDERIILGMSTRAAEELDQPIRRRSLLETLESHELDAAAARAMQSETIIELEVRLYAGGRRPYKAKVVPFPTEAGMECLIFLRDIADRVEYGELRSQFAATVSHELRTPLAGIQGLVESLQDPDMKAEESQRFLEKVEKETHRLGQLIDEILFLSSLESGSAEELKGECDLHALVADTITKLEDLAAIREVTVTNSVPEGTDLPLKERMAATVIANLVQNAINYSGIGARVEVEAVRESGHLKVTVRDDGIGIDAEHLPHIFERFYRVDKSRSRALGGTGLGLSIIKHIIESAGGAITATSREGFGTEISFTLPQ
ncbi:MAG: sensor histidine kinase [Thermoleophilia bacterium]